MYGMQTCPSQGCRSITGLPPELNSPVPIYKPVERHCRSKASCPRTQPELNHSIKNQVHTNHDATTPLSLSLLLLLLLTIVQTFLSLYIILILSWLSLISTSHLNIQRTPTKHFAPSKQRLLAAICREVPLSNSLQRTSTSVYKQIKS